MTDSGETVPAYEVPPSVAWVRDEREGQLRVYLAAMDDDPSPVVLEGMAALIWQLAREVAPGEIAAQLADATGEPRSSVADTVDQFLIQLVQERLLRRVDAGNPG